MMLRRIVVIVVLPVLSALFILLAACDQQPPLRFNNTDITGLQTSDFQLTDHTRKLRKLSDFKGKVVIVFFGFTHCPGPCPTAMAEFKLAMQKLGEDAKRVQVLFITVDPENDSPEVLAQYVPAFDKSFIGLHGGADITAQIAKDFKAFYQKVAQTGKDSYTVEHTAGSYAFDPQGRLRLYLSPGQDVDRMVSDVQLLLSGK